MPSQDQGGRPTDRPLEDRSPAGGETRFLAIGQIQAPHGVRGHFRVRLLTDFPDRFKTLKRVYLGEEQRLAEVESVRMIADGVLLRLKGVVSPEAAREFLHQLIYVPVEEAVTLPADQFYWYQIIGLEAWTTDERRLGVVVDIIATGSNDVYVVKSDDGEVLVPAIEDVVVDIDLEHKRLVVEPLEGML